MRAAPLVFLRALLFVGVSPCVPAFVRSCVHAFVRSCVQAPEESEASVAARMEARDEALSPMEVLVLLFPDVEPALLEAAFQEANGHLEQTVELLLTAMFFSR